METVIEPAFEFMEAVPSSSEEAKPGSLRWARLKLEEFDKLNKQHGCLLTGAQAAEILGVTRAFVRDLGARGKISKVEVKGLGWFYSGNDVLARLEEKPKSGRPPKMKFWSGLDRSE